MAKDWHAAALTPPNQALCAYAEKLTHTPAQITDADIETLRQHGFTDRAIHDATQVISYFNYINRIADGLDVALEQFVHPWEQSVPFR
ncbi:MAG: peroxidase [Anaerolineae bacterium]|nr:peroxidase [Anaerolineae bacterium]